MAEVPGEEPCTVDDGAPRVLITGATGLLGRQVLSIFKEQGWQVLGLGHSRASGSIVKCDLLDPEDMRARFDEFKPSIVIHCAAERRPDVLEKDKDYATRINVQLTHDLGVLCNRCGTWLINISTNYVFDGKAAPYAEDAAPNPVNTYGESKRAGEKVLMEVHPDSATVRIPLLYGQIEELGETSVTTLVNTIRKDAPQLDNWQERFPTYTTDIARLLEAVCKAYVKQGKVNAESFRGIFHWQSNERHTKWTMALIIAEIAGIDSSGFVRVDDAPSPDQAPRPQFERMLCSRLESLLRSAGLEPEDFRTDFKSSLAGHLLPFLPAVTK